jgi:hypothetical protein
VTTPEGNLPLTRADLREELRQVREDFHRELQLVRDDFHRELQHFATKADVAELRGELKGSLQTMRWMLAFGVSALAALILVLNFLG